MKTYNVCYETSEEIIDCVKVQANNLKHAKEIAQFNKRNISKRCRTNVKLDK